MIRMRPGRFSRSVVVDAAAYTIAIALFLLFFGRFLGLPLFFAAIASPSMEPVIRVGDVVVVQRGAPFGVGDVVMWCSSPFYCVVHRVVEVGPTYVVTKGDANPVNDLPVSPSSVVGKVVAVIPRETFLAAVILIVGAQVWSRRHSLLRPSDPLTFMVYGLIAFLALSVVTLLFFPAPSVFEVGEFPTPSVNLISAEYSNGTVTLRYRVENTQLIDIISCSFGARGIAEVRCPEAEVWGDGVDIPVPSSFLATLNERGLNRFWVSLVSSLVRNGTLKGNYTLIFEASRLAVNVVNGFLVVRNPNPFPVPYNLTIYYTNDGLKWVRNTSTGYLGGFEELLIKAGGWGRVWYRIRYTLMGEAIEVSGWVRRG